MEQSQNPDACAYDTVLAWVKARRDRLPTTLAELARYPMAYRRVIVGAVSSPVRVHLWQEHLESFLSPVSPLTQQQQAFVRECRDTVHRIFTEPVDREALHAWGERGRRILGPEQALRILATLGPPEPPGGLPLPPD